MRAGGEWAVSPEVQPSTAPVWGAGGGGEILPNGGALGGDSEALSRGEKESGCGHF